MKDPATLAPCSQFVQLLDEAFAEQLDVFDDNTKQMELYQAAIEKGHHAELTDRAGEPIDVIYAPEYMRQMRDYIHHCWTNTKASLLKAQSAGEQSGVMLKLMQDCFGESSLSGNCPLASTFFYSMIDSVAERYNLMEKACMDGTREEPLSEPEMFFAEICPQISTYAHLSLEALEDIESLTRASVTRHGLTIEDDVELTPYHLTKQRYCAARGIDYAPFLQIPEADKDQFLRKEQKFYRNELFGPWRNHIPDSCLCPEIAWFVVAAANVARLEQAQEELLIRENTWRRCNIRLQNEALPATPRAGFSNPTVDAIVRRGPMLGPIPKLAQDFGEPLERTLNDPKSQARIGELLDELCDDYPDLASNPGSLIQARTQFISTYLEHSPAPGQEIETSPVR